MVKPLGRTVWRVLKKLNIDPQYDTAVPLLGIYPEKTIILDTCTPLVMEALFTKAKTRKPLQGLSIEDWIKKMCYTPTMEYYLAIKKNEIMPFAATWMDLEIIILSEVKKRKKNII